MHLQNEFTKHLFNIYVKRKDLALNNLQRLIYHKTQLNYTKQNHFFCQRCDMIYSLL